MASRTNTQTTAHLLHDAGLAVWLGGSLMGAVGVNGASADLDDPGQRARAASDAWARWTPVNAAAIGAHLLGGALLLNGNKGRVKHQKGVKANTGVKLALTGTALAATAYARLLGKKVIDAGDVPVAAGTEPLAATPEDVAAAQRKLKALQWAIPGLTGAVLASSALHEEQQRPNQVLRGTLKSVNSKASGVAGDAAGRASELAGDLAGRASGLAGDVAGKMSTAAEAVTHKAAELRSV